MIGLLNGEPPMIKYSIASFIEGEKYRLEDFPFVETLNKKNFAYLEIFKGIFRMKITGFVIHEETLIVVYPKNFQLSDTPQQDASLLLRVLLRYREISSLEPEEARIIIGNEKFKTGRLSSALQLIEDYQKNGLIRRITTSRHSSYSGSVDWNRTIKTTLPIFSSGSPLYLEPITRINYWDSQNKIFLIHHYVICEAIGTFGWLLGLDTDIEPRFPFLFSSTEALSILEQELSQVFVQREITVLRLLIQYISGWVDEEDDNSIELLATPYFQNTWEAICSFLFANQYERFKGVIPPARWDSAIIEQSVSQRPDILYVHDDVFYILDAKYYDYRVSVPGWHDIVKQLFYGFTIREYRDHGIDRIWKHIDEIRNVFILPEHSQRDIVHIGDISIPGVNKLDKISVFSINVKGAMQAYVSRRTTSYRDRLASSLPSAI